MTSPAFLLPREHGAYAQALLPQITALVLGSASLPALLLAGAVLGAFLLHEPVLLALGRRGRRLRREAGPALAPWTWGLAALVVLCGGAGFWMSPGTARVAAGAVLAVSAGAAMFLARGREKSLAGELWVAGTFAAALVPTALAGSVPPQRALLAALLWFCVFGLDIVSVRALIAGWKTGRQGPRHVAVGLALGAVGAGLGMFLFRDATAAAAIVPPGLACLWALMAGLPPRRLRAVGWVLAGGAAGSFVVLVLAWV